MSISSADPRNVEKAIRLVEYLIKISTIRSKSIRETSEYEHVFWLSDVPHEKGCYTRAWGIDSDHDDDEWLEVKNSNEPKLPRIPSQCENWIDNTSLWNKADIPSLRKEIRVPIKGPDDDVESWKTEHLEDHPELAKNWDNYVSNEWFPWMEQHNSWEKVHKVYSGLFEIYQQQRKLGEEYELVLGQGLLTWLTPANQHISRHLIVSDAMLVFDSKQGVFTIKPNVDGARERLEVDMLDISDQPINADSIAKEGFSVSNDDPWNMGCCESVLSSLVHSINAQGEYLDSIEWGRRKYSNKPIVEQAPAIILRKRSSKGLTETLNKIKQNIEATGCIPDEFADVAEISNQAQEHSDGSYDKKVSECNEIYFPKLSNQEQRSIVERLCVSAGVLVQGPPGTGKSHTIANLICHLLATGQRILVTAKTPRALQVLENLIPSEMRSLCINLLGNGIEERKSLEGSISAILRKSEEWNEQKAIAEIQRLKNDLDLLNRNKALTSRRLRDIRESETKEQIIGEGVYRGSAARIAKLVSDNQSKYEWFRDTALPDSEVDFQVDELKQLLCGLRKYSVNVVAELNLKIVNCTQTPDEFLEYISEEAILLKNKNALEIDIKHNYSETLSCVDQKRLEELIALIEQLESDTNICDSCNSKWLRLALRDVMSGQSMVWSNIFDLTSAKISLVKDKLQLVDDTDIELPNDKSINALCNDVNYLRTYISQGKCLGWLCFRPKEIRNRLYIINDIKLNGHPCNTAERLEKLSDVLLVNKTFNDINELWAQKCDRIVGPFVIRETIVSTLLSELKKVLLVYNDLQRCKDEASKIRGLSAINWSMIEQIEDLKSSCKLVILESALVRLRKPISLFYQDLSILRDTNGVHSAIVMMLDAIKNKNIADYRCAYEKINEICHLKADYSRFLELTEKIFKSMPLLVTDLKSSFGSAIWDTRIAEIKEAWLWAQAHYWINEYINKDDIPALVESIKQIDSNISNTTAGLAALKAWKFCFSRMEDKHRRHMVGWEQSMRKLGKGTGKNAPIHRRDAQSHLNECKEAVPAWIMPLHRVWDTIDPLPNMFDVVIIDEASQCGLEGLPLFYLAKKILIVGDDKQISPEDVGLLSDDIFGLMDKYLFDFEHKSSFGLESSLFDQGRLRYCNNEVTLREHFRCMPEIIRFSNNLCYSNTPLIPLKQFGAKRLPPLEHYFVSDGYVDGENSRIINRPEAVAIVEKVVNLCNNPSYDGKSIGIIVLQGNSQAGFIEGMLLNRLSPEEIEERRIICGNPYSFQGDERDVIILSMVAASNKRIGPLTKSKDERRFNVAASRAKEQMILFHSVNVSDLSCECLRRKLLSFFTDTCYSDKTVAGIDVVELERRAHDDNRQIIRQPMPFGSWFEVDVALDLLRNGYDIIPQFNIAEKYIDIVVVGDDSKLAVECDGDHWHGVDEYEDDMHRQRMLERCGCEFFRIRESFYRANKDAALVPLWKLLDCRGIKPIGARTTDEEADSPIEYTDNIINGMIDKNNDLISDSSNKDMPDEVVSEDSNNRLSSVSSHDITTAIVSALKKCPNMTCTYISITARVLRELEIITRGRPRQKFENRVFNTISDLEKLGIIEIYKSTNKRIRYLGR